MGGAGDKQGRVFRKNNLVHPRLVCIVLYSGVVCCVVGLMCCECMCCECVCYECVCYG